jgi:OOP family OmpA-OmpF porin
VVVLLPDPDGKPGGITVTNAAGSQTLSQPYQAVHVGRDTSPTPPVAMDEAEVRRVFGDVLDALPKPEVVFTLYFGGDSDALLPESQAQMPAILDAIRERHSTAISVVGHTDMTASTDYNFKLGLRRAQSVADILHAQGVELSDIFVSSHGETDPVVKTARGVAERRNRRVEMIVR